MNNLIRTLTDPTGPLAQTVTLRPGEKVCDQNITPERWLTFGGSTLGLLLCLWVVWANTAAEASLTNLGRHRLHLLRERHVNRASLIEDLLGRPAQVMNAIALANTSCLVLATALALSAIHQFNFYGLEVTLFVLLLVFGVLSLARALPRGIALNRPESTALRYSKFINLETKVLRPVAWLVNATANALLRRAKMQPIPVNTVATEEEMSLLANLSQEEGLIEEEERAMIRSIFQFGDSLVREVMVPRLDVKAIPSSASLDETLDSIISSGKSRLPVYEPDVDHILGVLYAKDLLSYLRYPAKDGFKLQDLLRPAYYVPESKKVDELFAELQNQHVHIAVIVDEYGGTAGVVTIEDLLEEIVGEIQDEYDTEAAVFERIGLDEVLVDARLILPDVNDFFHTEWQSEDIETVGGFVYDKLGRIPSEGDELLVDGQGRLLAARSDGSFELDREEYPADQPETVSELYRISVLKVTEQRLRQLRLQHLTVPATSPELNQAEQVGENKEKERNMGRLNRKRTTEHLPDSDGPPPMHGGSLGEA